MDRFHAMQVFAQVVESDSFIGAAKHLDLSPSAVSRHVAELEAHLQTRLLQRTTRRISLTDSGRRFYERCVELLAELDEAEQEAASATATPAGAIRLTTSINFGVRHVAPSIAAFLALYPKLRFEVSLSDRIVDLVEEGFDLAIRVGAPGSENLVARKLAEARIVPCASPQYLAQRGVPKTPQDLVHHNCFIYEYLTPRGQWTFRDASGREHTVRISGNVHSNNGDLLAEAAAQGAGIAFEPTFIVGPEIRSGRLVPLLQDYQSPLLAIYAVYPSRRHLSAKIRLFVEFLLNRFADSPDWTGVNAA